MGGDARPPGPPFAARACRQTTHPPHRRSVAAASSPLAAALHAVPCFGGHALAFTVSVLRLGVGVVLVFWADLDRIVGAGRVGGIGRDGCAVCERRAGWCRRGTLVR